MSSIVALKDGAMGTMLMEAGIAMADIPEAPTRCGRVVERIHRDYIEAGASIVTTATFSLPLNGHKRADCMAAAIDLAAEAAAGSSREVRVAGCVGPCRESGRDEMMRYYVPVIETFFKRGGVEMIIAETIMGMRHASMIHEIVRAIDADITLVLSGTPSQSGPTLLDGEPVAGLIALSARDSNTIAGLNCFTLPPVSMPDSAIGFLAPSAGMPGNYAGPQKWAGDFAPVIVGCENSPVIAGGCCGTTPAHIAELAQMLQKQSV